MSNTHPTSEETITSPSVKAEGSFKKALSALWGASVIAQGYTVCPTILIWGQGKLGVDNNELSVLIHIVSHRWKSDNIPFISKETISDRMGVDQRTVQRYVTSLENKGLIRRVKRFKPTKGQDANGFDITGLLTKLKEIAPDFKKMSDFNKKRRAAVQKPPETEKVKKSAS